LFIEALCSLIDGVDYHGVNGDLIANGHRSLDGIDQ
jgi:hypothetical protein